MIAAPLGSPDGGAGAKRLRGCRWYNRPFPTNAGHSLRPPATSLKEGGKSHLVGNAFMHSVTHPDAERINPFPTVAHV